jgi:uncharacterized protein (TIGR02466 family)
MTPLYGGTLFRGMMPDFEEHREALLETVYKLYDDEKGLARSNQGGWQSNDRLFESEQKEFKWLAQVIRDLGGQCIKQAEGPYLQGGILLGAMWANLNPYGAWNAPHTHMPCEWVGVCYLKTNETPTKRGKEAGPAEGDLMLLDTQQLGPQYRGQRPIFQHYSPKNGEFFIFPGYILHMVAPHLDQEDRISVAFNFRLEQHLKRPTAR